MKFSILLPTRNRLEFLKYAIYSVVNQDYRDWEVIIFDNFSEEDIAGYVQSLNEPRIKYFRTTSFVPVTENWNNALEKSSGDYVIMLGDDDCLMKGCLTTLNKLIEQHTSPDLIYMSGFLYGYPGVLPGCPDGFLNVFGNASFLQKKQASFWLSKNETLKLVKEAMNFKVMFAYNMQYAVISRTMVNKLKQKGDFFQPPYPDYYAMTALLLNAGRILAYPFPLVTVGISPKSFGFYYFNQREKQGLEFLKNSSDHPTEGPLRNIFLPGTNMNDSWLLSMEAVKNNFKEKINFGVNYKRYRLIQIVRVYKRWVLEDKANRAQMEELWKRLSWREKFLYGIPFHFIASLILFSRGAARLKIVRRARRMVPVINSNPIFHSQLVGNCYKTIQQVFDEVDPANYQKNT